MEIIYLVVEEQLKSIPTSKPMEKEELQQLMSSGEECFQELFEGPICNINSSMLNIKNKNHDEAKRQNACKTC